MQRIFDLHIHSKYSRACSRDLELPKIAKACERKGIDVVACADFTHPKWFAHVQESLELSAPGIYHLRDKSSVTQFLLGTELSQIYKRDGVTRRVHNLVFAPSLEVVARINAAFDARGFNRSSDGRPILGIDSEDLYTLLKEIDEQIVLIPAHAWTPWYAVFGSKSGFDSLEACFGKMTPHIPAIETGLSSDPAMNARLSQLDGLSLISNSDAHSLDKLGREANVFDLPELSYAAFFAALRARDPKQFLSTIEFYPEEGKYHWDGCAASGFSCAPEDTKKHDGRCPVCKKPLTLGVEHRVLDLADKPKGSSWPIPHRSIVPLREIIGETLGVSATSKKVVALYETLIREVGNEFFILLQSSPEQILEATESPRLVEALLRVREGRLTIAPGYDGVYGKVKIFSEEEKAISGQRKLL